jgi:hypothetical protein
VLLAVAGFVALALAAAGVLVGALSKVAGEARQARTEAALRLAWLGAEAALPVLARTQTAPPLEQAQTPSDSEMPAPVLRLPMSREVTLTLVPASAPEALDPRTATEETLSEALEAAELQPPEATRAARNLVAARARTSPLTLAQWFGMLELSNENTAAVTRRLAPRLVVGLAGQAGLSGWQVAVEAGGLTYQRFYLLSAPTPQPGLAARAAQILWHSPTEIGVSTAAAAIEGFAPPG